MEHLGTGIPTAPLTARGQTWLSARIPEADRTEGPMKTGNPCVWSGRLKPAMKGINCPGASCTSGRRRASVAESRQMPYTLRVAKVATYLSDGMRDRAAEHFSLWSTRFNVSTQGGARDLSDVAVAQGCFRSLGKVLGAATHLRSLGKLNLKIFPKARAQSANSMPQPKTCWLVLLIVWRTSPCRPST